MIRLHKLKGEVLWINPDQIIFAEGAHESVVTLLDGKHVVTSESPDAIAEAVVAHRAKILALAGELARSTEPGSVRALRAVPSEEG